VSPTKTKQPLSPSLKPSAPIIEDWISDSEEDSQTQALKVAPSFTQSTEHVRSPRHPSQLLQATILAVTIVLVCFKTPCHGPRRNKKACFVCKSVDHLIKDYEFHSRKLTQRTYASRDTRKQPVSAALPNLPMTRPRHAYRMVTKSNSPIRRHLPRSPSSKHSNSPTGVTAAKALVDNPQQALQDKGVIDSGCSRHMIGNMSYLSDFKELNGGYVSFGGNPKGGKITGKGKIKTSKLDFDDVYFVKELKFNLFSVSYMCNKKNSVLFTDSECLVLSPDFKLPDESQVLLRIHLGVFLTTKDETTPILKTFITGLENQLSLKVKVIQSDNGTEFKNSDLNQFCGIKGIKREFSVPRTPQQNGIAERKNMTLIEAARTKLTFSLLPNPFWAEAVNTACYVQNRVLVTKPHNKTPYELLHGRTPSIGFMRPFGCPVTILNTLDHLGKFPRKVDEGFLVGYSVCSKAFRVLNSRTHIIQETLHVNFLENKPNVIGTGPIWMFDIDSLSGTMNYHLVSVENQPLSSAGFQDPFDAEKVREEVTQTYVLFPACNAQTRKQADKSECENKEKSPVKSFTRYRDSNTEFEGCSNNSSNGVNAASSTVPTVGHNFINNTNIFSAAGPSNTAVSPTYGKSSSTGASTSSHNPDMPALEELTYSDDEAAVGARLMSIIWNLQFQNKKDERSIVIRNKARLVAQGHTQEEGINYKEVFAPVARIEAIRLFLAYASFMGFLVYQMDVKSAFLYGTIKDLCKSFEKLMKDRFQMSYMGELTFFLGKSASTPIDTEKPLLKDLDGEDIDDPPFDLVAYSDSGYAGVSLDRKSTTRGCQFLGCRLISWQCKKQTVVATSSTEAEYVAVASGCAQVLWIQN
nr:hypothetical protein [Tanacetum cinerariifolium]